MHSFPSSLPILISMTYCAVDDPATILFFPLSSYSGFSCACSHCLQSLLLCISPPSIPSIFQPYIPLPLPLHVLLLLIIFLLLSFRLTLTFVWMRSSSTLMHLSAAWSSLIAHRPIALTAWDRERGGYGGRRGEDRERTRGRGEKGEI